MDKEEVARKLRAVVKEYGQESLKNAVIISGEYMDGRIQMCGLPYIDCPTFASATLGKVTYEVARFFEDI